MTTGIIFTNNMNKMKPTAFSGTKRTRARPQLDYLVLVNLYGYFTLTAGNLFSEAKKSFPDYVTISRHRHRLQAMTG